MLHFSPKHVQTEIHARRLKRKYKGWRDRGVYAREGLFSGGLYQPLSLSHFYKEGASQSELQSSKNI